jgi:hypothetical protein
VSNNHLAQQRPINEGVHEVVDLAGGVAVDEAAEDVGGIGMGSTPVELAGLDQLGDHAPVDAARSEPANGAFSRLRAMGRARVARCTRSVLSASISPSATACSRSSRAGCR